jgi:hypothetical protein
LSPTIRNSKGIPPPPEDEYPDRPPRMRWAIKRNKHDAGADRGRCDRPLKRRSEMSAPYPMANIAISPLNKGLTNTPLFTNSAQGWSKEK